LQEVCRDAMRVIAPDWSRPPEDWLFNHRWRDGGICPRTGRPLQREPIGGRTTCWSPAWQCYRG
jgi:formamidopyrimidine-DNA glycosylase